MTGDINEVPGASPSLRTELGRRLEELVPEAIADGKVDVAKLQELLAEDSADDSERFGLFWPGKKRALRAAQEPTTATLRPVPAESKDWDTTQNVFIEGDNLEVLKILQRGYHNKIKMIYIDPPYNTGKDFVYPDDFKEGLQSYLEFTGQVDGEGRRLSTNSDADGRYHSNWLNMMYPRLKLARNLLTDDGVIFISIDDHEADNLKKSCHEVFGERNFLGVIVWRTATDNNPTNIATDHEYVLAYARSLANLDNWEVTSAKARAIADQYEELKAQLGDDVPAIQRELRKWIRLVTSGGDVDLDGVSHYSYVDERGVFYPGNSANTKPGGYMYDIVHPVTGKATAKPLSGWRWPKETFDKAVAAGDVHWGEDHTSVPKIKKRIETATELLKSSYYEDNRGSTAQLAEMLGVKAFDNPKSVSLIRRLVKFATSGDDFILDFFSGSGTTAHAVMLQNAEDGGCRRHIQVQLPEPTPKGSPAREAGFMTIADVGRTRISTSGDRVVAQFGTALAERNEPLDIGYRAYKLVDTNFSKWRIASDIGQDDLQQRLLDLRESSNDAATEEDLLAEILLKQGYSLTEHTEHLDVAGLSTWRVGAGDLVAYLNEHTKPTLDQLRELAGSGASRLVIVEDAFHGDDELKTNLAQLCKTNDVELWTA
jgi:adenine-specific DNA-methyltransferase